MTYRSLLVVLDHDPQCPVRTQTALQLARRFECHLTGLVPTGLVELPAVPGAAASMSDYAARVRDALRDQADRLADRFRDECHGAAMRSFDAVIEEADRAEAVVRRARCSDLVVLGQSDPSSVGHRVTRDFVEQVVLHSARPTLVLPYAGRHDGTGSRVLVAWDDSREAARAVADALPFLEQATEVNVVAWNENGSVDPQTLSAGLAAVCGWLKHHGVPALPRLEPATQQVADSMLSRAADWSSDLIVMGAYGHARWTERILGGATRGLLRSMTVPVLMSH